MGASVVLSLLYYAAQPAWELMARQKNLEEARATISRLKQDKMKLLQKKRLLKKDEHLELKAREELGLVKEGEQAYMISKTPPTAPAKKEAVPREEDDSFVEAAGKWLKSILGFDKSVQ